MSIQKARKIGFLSAISILIGSIIGIGIFLKNNSVFETNNYNGFGVLISWTIAAIISILTAFSFAEVSSSERSKAGLAGWMEKMVGKKAGYMTKINLPIFYFSILLVCIFIFTSESIFFIFPNEMNSKVHFGWVVFVGFILFAIILTTSALSTKVAKNMQMWLTAAKFIPIVLVIIIGLIFFERGNNLFDSQVGSVVTGSGKTKGPISFTGILSSLPAILFAFDSFLGVGNLSKDLRKPKQVPLVIIVGMILCSVIYLLVTVVQILNGQGTLDGVFSNIFKNDIVAQNAFSYIIKISMFVSVLGVGNSITMSAIRSYDHLIHEKIIFKHNFFYLLGRKKELIPGAMMLFSVGSIIFFINLILALVFNHDAYVDGMSNFPTLFFFAIYATVILFTLINRKTNKVKVEKVKFFIPIATVACIGIYFIFGYQFFYEFLVRPLLNVNDTLKWGLFYGPSSGAEVKNWQGAIVFFVFLFIFIILPFLNTFLIKLERKYSNYKFNKEIQKLCQNQ